MRAGLVATALAGVAALVAVPTATAMKPIDPATPRVTTVRSTPATSAPSTETRRLRRATARFHDIAAAEAAGYVPFTDVHGISCISEDGMGAMGAMGVHYVNPRVIADPSIRGTAPEALVYAPDRDGTLRLAALEYLVPRAVWDARHARAPQLFAGRPFSVTTAPNRYGLPTFYSQHVWVWKANPAGLLAMWNPTVHCGWA